MKRLARAILNAQRIREESFDPEAVDRLEKKDGLIKDYDQCYTKSQRDAADEAAENEGFDTRGTLPIYLLNQYCWNDIQAWAKDMLK